MSSPEKFWQGLADAISQPDLFDDPRFADRAARINNQDALISLLTEIFKKRPRAQWCERLEQRDVPYAPMYDSSEALQDPQAVHLQMEVSAEHPLMGTFRTVRSPVTYDSQRSLTVTPPPVLDEHRGRILALLRDEHPPLE